jgi:hypothetical protein
MPQKLKSMKPDSEEKPPTHKGGMEIKPEKKEKEAQPTHPSPDTGKAT